MEKIHVRMEEDQEVSHAEDQKIQRAVELEDLKLILATPHGIRFFKRFFDSGMMFKTTFTGNSQGMFLEGHRNLALKFFHDICEACPERIPELIMRGELKK